MELLFELVLELATAGVAYAAKYSPVKWVKVTARVIALLFFLLVFTFIGYGGFLALCNGEVLYAVIIFAFDLLMIALSLRKLIKIIRRQ